MRRLDIVIAVLQQDDQYLLQLRGNIPKIGGANLIGFFGGKIEADETPLQAVCRELAEETSFAPPAKAATRMGKVEVTSDHQLEEVHVVAEIFRFTVPADAVVEAKEGSLVTLTRQQAFAGLDKMTTGTRAIFEQLIKEK